MNEQNNTNILIIEDNQITAYEIAEILRQSGYHITDMVMYGEDAIKSARKNPPDLALVDISLKGKMDGIETVRILKTIKDFPIIYLTGEAQITDAVKETRPANYLHKPVAPDNLLRAVDLALHTFDNSDQAQAYVVRDSFYLLGGKNLYERVPLTEILWVEANGAFVIIKTTKTSYKIAINLTTFMRKYNTIIKSNNLPNTLVRIRNSHVINLNHVTAFNNTDVYIKDNGFSISKTYCPDFAQHFIRIRAAREQWLQLTVN